jgi:hypothetical protein
VCPYCDFELDFEEAAEDRYGRECHVECLPPTKKQRSRSKAEAEKKVEEFLQTEFPENPDH